MALMDRFKRQLADELPERYEGQREANEHVGNLAFPYSLYFVFYEQYAYIQVRKLQYQSSELPRPQNTYLLGPVGPTA